MEWRKVSSFAEIIGMGTSFLIFLAPGLLGLPIETIFFIRVVEIYLIAFLLRPIASIFFYVAVIGTSIAFYVARKSNESKENSKLTKKAVSLRFLSGWLIMSWILYVIVNSIILRDSLITYPFMIGSTLLFFGILDFGQRGSYEREKDSDSDNRQGLTFGRLVHFGRYGLIGLLSLVLIIPTILPMSGFLPTPPENPTGYGGDTGPYAVDKVRLQHEIPSNITNYLVPINDQKEWYIFLYLPQITKLTQIPVAIYAHGFSVTDPIDYEKTLYQLASRGIAVIFVQYATSVKLAGPFEDAEGTEEMAGNAMYFRYLMEWSGIVQAINEMQNAQLVQPGLLNLDYIQIIGHSLGGGMIPYLATKILQQGWGTTQLILDLESPWYAADHPLVQHNLSWLPNGTIVNIVGTEDDHLASPCIGMQHFELFYADLEISNLAYILMPSDFHGFPRLLATQYVVNDRLVDDTLTRRGYLKRVDAMSDFLVAEANGHESSTIKEYFVGGGQKMISLGNWSDGTPVNPLIYSQDPFGQRTGENLAELFATAHDDGLRICTA